MLMFFWIFSSFSFFEMVRTFARTKVLGVFLCLLYWLPFAIFSFAYVFLLAE